MIYIGYIVDRETTGVEIHTAESFKELGAWVDERYAEYRDEYSDADQRFDWDYTTRTEWVKKEGNE